jgi:hypothetical protein
MQNKIALYSVSYLILSILLLIFNTRPHYLYLTDIEAAYYMSAYLVMNNELPVFYFHPGTFFQYISSFLLKIGNFNKLDQISSSLTYLKIFSIIFNFFSIIIFLKTFKKYNLKNSFKILIICILYPATLLYVTYFGVNSITLGLALILSSAYIKNFYNQFNSLLSLSIISGICLNSKLIFLPCLIIIFINILLDGDRLFNPKNFLKAFSYTILTTFVFFIVGFKMMHTYPEILIKVFVRPEGNLGLINYFFVVLISVLITFYFSNLNNSLNYKIKTFLLIFFVVYFTFIVFKYFSIDYLPTFFRYQAAFFIFALILLNLNFNLKFLNIFLIFIIALFFITHFKAYENTQFQRNVSASYINYVDKKIKENYFIYFWTGSGNDSYDSQNFIEWSDLRYGNSYLKKNNLTNFENKQIYNIRLDIKNYDISQNYRKPDNFKNKIKNILVEYKIFPEEKFERNLYNINTNLKNKCLLLIFTKFEFDIEINKLKSNKLFKEKPILFLEMITTKELQEKKIMLAGREFIIFFEDEAECINKI